MDLMPVDPIRNALVESRQRWQHLVGLATDLAFETDANGRFAFITPADAIGWPVGSLIGQPSEMFIGDDRTGVVLNPFHPVTAITRHQSWVRRFGGELAMMSFTVVPLHDAEGTIVGSRGVGIDITDNDTLSAHIVGRLRRGEVLDHILSRVSQETDTESMMDAALWALVNALGAAGSAVIGRLSDSAPAAVLHECGPNASAGMPAVAMLIDHLSETPHHTISPDGHFVLAVGCQTRFGMNAGLILWRNANERAWDAEDTMLAGSAVRIVRMVLEYAAFAREMAHQARTDPLTGLLNRRAFLEETRRHIARLDRDVEAATLMFVDLDGFKAINDLMGHAAGDQVLVHFADMLRKLVRPSDVIARLGGDEFAVWLSGIDQTAAVERADYLCRNVPSELQALLPQALAGLGASVGIATRCLGSRETIEDLIRRADMAMYEVKRGGRGHWRVSLLGSA